MSQPSNVHSAIEAMMAQSHGAWEMALNWPQEFLRFFGRRMSGYVELTSKLPHCRDPRDLLALQTRFFQQMLVDYRAEAEWMTSKMFRSETSVQKQIERVFDSYEEMLVTAQRDAAKFVNAATEEAKQSVNEAQHERKATYSGRRVA